MSTAQSTVSFATRKMAVDIPNLIFATAIAGWVAWFCWDAWRGSHAVENLILIAPVSAVALVLYFFVVAGCFKRIDQAEEQPTSPLEPLARRTAIKIAGSMTLLAAFVLVGPLIGFDIACFAYILLMMAFLGERRFLVLLLVPLVFCVAVIYCFGTLLSTPLPVLLLRGFNR